MQQSANIINNSTSDIYIIANQYIKKSPYKQLFGVKCRGFRCNHYNLFTCSNYEKSDNINKITISKGTNKYVNKFQKLTIYIYDNFDYVSLYAFVINNIKYLIKN
jgi:hypothetical protein